MTDRAAAEEALRQWRQVFERRDEVIKAAHQAGVSIRRIHILTRVGRSTIYRILASGAENGGGHGAQPGHDPVGQGHVTSQMGSCARRRTVSITERAWGKPFEQQ